MSAHRSFPTRVSLRILLAFSLAVAGQALAVTALSPSLPIAHAETEAEKQAKEQAKADEKAAKEQAKADEEAAKEQAKADEEAAKEQAKAEQEQAKEEEKAAEGGSGEEASTEATVSSSSASSSSGTAGGSSGGSAPRSSAAAAATHPGCPAGAKLHVIYHFEFADGQVVDGCVEKNEATVAGFSDSFHVSCSDAFTGGFGLKGSPVQALGEPQILNYLIIHNDVKKEGETEKKRCGETFGTLPPPGDLSVNVVKTNDANGDGTFHDLEEAPQAGASVVFRALITNTGTIPLVIDSLVDVFPGSTLNVCANLLGTTLQPAQSVTCLFTVPGYAPPAGGTLTDTVTVVGHDEAVPANTATDSDDSRVTTPSPVGPGGGGGGGGGGAGVGPAGGKGKPQPQPAPPAPSEAAEAPGAAPLPFTGFEASTAVLVAMSLFFLGSLLVGLGRRRASKAGA